MLGARLQSVCVCVCASGVRWMNRWVGGSIDGWLCSSEMQEVVQMCWWLFKSSGGPTFVVLVALQCAAIANSWSVASKRLYTHTNADTVDRNISHHGHLSTTLLLA